MSRILAIGDVHIKISNLEDIEVFIQRLDSTIQAEMPDKIIILGDVLNTFERIHTTCLSYAQRLFTLCSSYSPTYVLVGNHDYISNSQFLTSAHWMTPFYAWPNLTIVDKVVEFIHHEQQFVCCPYVSDGRFVEALETHPTWRTARMIFGHQLLNGAKMGAIVAEHVEEWKEEYPFLCCGHIHEKQLVQPNLYYTGTPMQDSFAERRNKSIVLFTVGEEITRKEIELKVNIKRIEYLTIQQAYQYQLEVDSNESVRLTIKGTKEECSVFKKSIAFKTLSALAKLVFDEQSTEFKHEKEEIEFQTVLFESIHHNYFLTQLYKRHASISCEPDIQFMD